MKRWKWSWIAAYLDGSTFDFGAVCALKQFANPISVARALSAYKVNNVLVGEGAAAFAKAHHFEEKDMLTDRAKIHFHNRLKDIEREQLTPYAGHDTVGMVGLDASGDMVAGTSTSGLFMKKPGRVGDSPFYRIWIICRQHDWWRDGNGSRGRLDERRDFV